MSEIKEEVPFRARYKPESPSRVLQKVSAKHDLRTAIGNWRAQGFRIGFVPTTGSPHEGQLALIRRALILADRVVVSIFLDPSRVQCERSPTICSRTLERDTAILQDEGCHLLFVPESTAVYPPGDTATIEPGQIAKGLEGSFLPQRFRGVATLISRLLNIVQPDFAIFGENDAQRMAVIRSLARDLYLPVEIIGHKTVRQEDGLPYSSRNRTLSTEERQAATVIYGALLKARRLIRRGERSAEAIRSAMRDHLAIEPLARIDYAEVVDATTFEPVNTIEGPVILPMAVWIGETRLIDNFKIDPKTFKQPAVKQRGPRVRITADPDFTRPPDPPQQASK